MEQAETKTEERMLEEQHLQKVIEIADCQTKEAFETIERQKEEMLEAKKEVRENGVKLTVDYICKENIAVQDLLLIYEGE